MPYVGLPVLLHLRNICRVGEDMHEEVHLTDSILHLRCGHVSKSEQAVCVRPIAALHRHPPIDLMTRYYLIPLETFTYHFSS